MLRPYTEAIWALWSHRDIFNTDQGCPVYQQGISLTYLKENNIKISMDGRGRAQDNIFVERLWWMLKHQYVYLYAFDTVPRLHAGLKQWFEFYNFERFHQGLDNRTPDEVYFGLN